MGQIGQGISLRGLYVEPFNFPFFISGTVTSADIGKAVALDLTAENTVKLAGDGDIVIGRLETYEDRKVEGTKLATVNLKGGFGFTYEGTAPTVGQSVVGSATAGTVKAAVASAYNVVTEVDAGTSTCTVILK